jgi:hypothetical protein
MMRGANSEQEISVAPLVFCAIVFSIAATMRLVAPSARGVPSLARHDLPAKVQQKQAGVGPDSALGRPNLAGLALCNVASVKEEC